MTIQQLNIKLSGALRKRIRELDHILTGDMYKSIEFKCSDNGKLVIKFKSIYYIKFLDEGDFISEFVALQSTRDIIKEYIREKLINNVQIK